MAASGGCWPRAEGRNISQKLFWWLIFSLVWYRRHPAVPVPSRHGGGALQGTARPEELHLKALTQTMNVPLFWVNKSHFSESKWFRGNAGQHWGSTSPAIQGGLVWVSLSASVSGYFCIILEQENWGLLGRIKWNKEKWEKGTEHKSSPLDQVLPRHMSLKAAQSWFWILGTPKVFKK